MKFSDIVDFLLTIIQQINKKMLSIVLPLFIEITMTEVENTIKENITFTRASDIRNFYIEGCGDR